MNPHSKAAPTYQFGPFQVYAEDRLLLREEQQVPVTPKVLDALLFLVERSGRLVTKDELMNALWPGTFVSESNLTQTIFMLRKALGESASEQRYVMTVPGTGYRFVTPVEKENPEPAVAISGASGIGKTQRKWLVWTCVVVALVATCAGAYWAIAPLPPPRVRQVILMPASTHADPWQQLVSDGARVYFLETAGDRWDVMETSAAGGETHRATMPFERARIYDISRASGEFLLGKTELRGSPEPLWAWPAQGGTPVRIGNILVHAATWFPNGQEVLYAVRSDIRRVRRDGSDNQLVLHTSGAPAWLRFSPDGRRIRFSLFDRRTEAVEMWEMSSDGKNAHPYKLSDEGHECCGNWTEDGRYFLYTAYRGGIANLWAVREKGAGLHIGSRQPVQLTAGANALFEALPVNDGNRIFSYVQARDYENVRYDFKSHEFTPHLPGKQMLTSSYSKDGRRMAYLLSPDSSLWESNADGSGAFELVAPPMKVTGHPQWSPDGQWIAFEAYQPGKVLRAYVVSAQGGPPEEVFPREGEQSLPAWSPDGESVAVALNVLEENAKPEDQGIFIVNRKTRETIKMEGSERLTYPQWSPDGKQLVARTPDNHDILLFDPASKKWKLISHGEQLAGPVWSLDSKYLYVEDVREARQPVYRVSIRNGKTERVVTLDRFLTGGVGLCVIQTMTPDGQLIISLMRKGVRVHAIELDLP